MPRLTIFFGFDGAALEGAVYRALAATAGREDVAMLWPELDVRKVPVHPASHGDIADRWLAPGRPVITCTHSDPFILRVRRRIAERTLSPSDVALVWVEEDGTEKPIPLNDRGTPAWWPRNGAVPVFAEAQEEFRALHRALKARDQELICAICRAPAAECSCPARSLNDLVNAARKDGPPR